jgi:DNA-binding GntR family transcriptional regulator
MRPMKPDDEIVSVIQRQSVASQVYLDLRNRILTGQFSQGERIVEAAIAKSLGVSRAPVREAVNRLTEAGLLENRVHYGPSVVQMDLERIRELYAVRNAIEGLAIRAVALNHSNRDLLELRRLIEKMAAEAESGDLVALVEAELQFHQALWRMAGNPYIEKMANLLFDHMRLALILDNGGYVNLADVACEHLPLVEAIETGDPDKAARSLTTHIMSSLEKYSPR